MTLKVDFSKASDWGFVTLGDKRYSARAFIGWCGIAFWLAMMFIGTGLNGFSAIRDVSVYMLFLIASTIFTRTIPATLIMRMFLIGAFMMGIAAALAKVAHAVFPDTMASTIVVPLLENTLFLAPVLWFICRKKTSIWLLGASDIMLLFAACGTGFSMVEAAWMRVTIPAYGDNPVWFLPNSVMMGDRIRGEYLCNDQSIWGTLAGVSVGLALLFRTGFPLWKFVAVAGILLGLLDHFALNYRASHGLPDLIRNTTGGVLLNGQLTMYLTIMGVIATVAADLFALYRVPTNMKPTASKHARFFSRKWWRLELTARRMAYSFFRYLCAGDGTRGDAGMAYAHFRSYVIDGYHKGLFDDKIKGEGGSFNDRSFAKASSQIHAAGAEMQGDSVKGAKPAVQESYTVNQSAAGKTANNESATNEAAIDQSASSESATNESAS